MNNKRIANCEKLFIADFQLEPPELKKKARRSAQKDDVKDDSSDTPSSDNDQDQNTLLDEVLKITMIPDFDENKTTSPTPTNEEALGKITFRYVRQISVEHSRSEEIFFEGCAGVGFKKIRKRSPRRLIPSVPLLCPRVLLILFQYPVVNLRKEHHGPNKI